MGKCEPFPYGFPEDEALQMRNSIIGTLRKILGTCIEDKQLAEKLIKDA